MKFVTSAQRLVRAIQAVGSLAPGVGKRFQIESMLFTVTDDGYLEVQATDLVDSYWFKIPPEEGREFQPGKLFVGSVNMVRAIKEAGKNEITIERQKNRALVSWGTTQVKMPIEDEVDAPAIRRVCQTDPYVSLPAQRLMDLLKRVNFAVSTDFKNRAMSFLRVEVKKHSLRFSATDGVRIASAEVDVQKSAEDYLGVVYVLPIKPTKVKLLVDGEEEKPVKFRLTGDMISVSTDSAEMTVRLGAASWPDFDIERELTHEKRVVVPTAELKRLLSGAELLKARGEITCDFKWDPNGLEMEAAAAIEGQVNAKIMVPWTYEPMTIKLDPGFFWDVVSACSADAVQLAFSASDDPLVLREEDGNMVYLCALAARY